MEFRSIKGVKDFEGEETYKFFETFRTDKIKYAKHQKQNR